MLPNVLVQLIAEYASEYILIDNIRDINDEKHIYDLDHLDDLDLDFEDDNEQLALSESKFDPRSLFKLHLNSIDSLDAFLNTFKLSYDIYRFLMTEYDVCKTDRNHMIKLFDKMDHPGFMHFMMKNPDKAFWDYLSYLNDDTSLNFLINNYPGEIKWEYIMINPNNIAVNYCIDNINHHYQRQYDSDDSDTVYIDYMCGIKFLKNTNPIAINYCDYELVFNRICNIDTFNEVLSSNTSDIVVQRLIDNCPDKIHLTRFSENTNDIAIRYIFDHIDELELDSKFIYQHIEFGNTNPLAIELLIKHRPENVDDWFKIYTNAPDELKDYIKCNIPYAFYDKRFCSLDDDFIILYKIDERHNMNVIDIKEMSINPNRIIVNYILDKLNNMHITNASIHDDLFDVSYLSLNPNQIIVDWIHNIHKVVSQFNIHKFIDNKNANAIDLYLDGDIYHNNDYNHLDIRDMLQNTDMQSVVHIISHYDGAMSLYGFHKNNNPIAMMYCHKFNYMFNDYDEDGYVKNDNIFKLNTKIVFEELMCVFKDMYMYMYIKRVRQSN